MSTKAKTTSGSRKIVSRAASAAAVAAICMPAVASAAPKGNGDNGRSDALTKYERRYLEVRHEFVEANGVRAAGRNIVRDGYLEHDGDVHTATRSEVKDSVVTMKPPAVTAPTAPAETAASTEVTEAATYSGGAAASSATAQCESGGDYGAVNPAGYYGAYQFDQGTWDAYAPSGYAGVNPATAPPEVQDAAAAAVPYDAWPNC